MAPEGQIRMYIPTLRREAYRNSFMYMGDKMWNELPESTNNESFIYKYKMYKRIINSCHNRHTYFLFAICQFPHYFVNLWKFNSVHGYGFLYLLGTEFKSHLMSYLCHQFTWFVFSNGFINSHGYFYILPNSFRISFCNIIFIVSLYAISINELCFMLIFVVMYINGIVVYGSTSCKPASGWRVILVKYVLIK